MAKLSRFEDLACWQEARELALKIYKVIKKETFKRDFQPINQIRGAAISVMANIAEGFTRQSDKEFVHFLFIAMASAAEVMSHLYIVLWIRSISPEMNLMISISGLKGRQK